MKYVTQFFNLQGLSVLLMSVFIFLKMHGLDADSFLLLAFAFTAVVLGFTFSIGGFTIKGIILKAISIGSVLILSVIATDMIERRLNDLIFFSIWLPYWITMVYFTMAWSKIENVEEKIVGKQETD